jgi:hypothetical protein
MLFKEVALPGQDAGFPAPARVRADAVGDFSFRCRIMKPDGDRPGTTGYMNSSAGTSLLVNPTPRRAAGPGCSKNGTPQGHRTQDIGARSGG